MLETILLSMGAIALSEIGDKTQLLALALAAHYRKPIPIVLGILCATLLNHWLAAMLGYWINAWLTPEILRWVLIVSFIGMGIQAPMPEWGAMLSNARTYIRDAWHITVMPGAAIMITILILNIIGDGLRDALDPRMKN